MSDQPAIPALITNFVLNEFVLNETVAQLARFAGFQGSSQTHPFICLGIQNVCYKIH